MKRNRQKPRRLDVQCLENRQLLTASVGWDGPGQGSASLTYHISNAPSTLTSAQVQSAIQTALNVWSSVADIKFTPTTQVGLKNSLDISFTKLDGPGGTLAQAYFPADVNPAQIAGDVQFDSSENWEIGNAKGSSYFDLVYVAVHEIGHALGLEHDSVAGSVLEPTVSPNQQFTALSPADVAAIEKLYAAPSSNGNTTPTTTIPTTTTPTNTTPTTTTPTSTTPTTTTIPTGTFFSWHHWHRSGHHGRANSRITTTNTTSDSSCDSNNTVDNSASSTSQLNSIDNFFAQLGRATSRRTSQRSSWYF